MPDNDATEIVLKHLSVVRIEPGDTLVFRTPDHLSLAQLERFRDAFRDSFRGIPDMQVIVLEGDMELAVLRPDADPGG